MTTTELHKQLQFYNELADKHYEKSIFYYEFEDHHETNELIKYGEYKSKAHYIAFFNESHVVYMAYGNSVEENLVVILNLIS
jgi:hypothetical protein